MEIVYIGKEFINLYSKDNPVLETDDECYFLLANNIDYHRPLVCRGIIKIDNFVDGLNKQYYIKILDILESPKIISDFLVGKPITVYPYINEILKSKKTIQLTKSLNLENYLFKIDAFFVRLSEQNIKDLRLEYVNIIRKDMENMLNDIDNMTT